MKAHQRSILLVSVIAVAGHCVARAGAPEAPPAAPASARPAAGPAAGGAAPLAPGAPVDYAGLAFQPDDWRRRGLDFEMVPWAGREVVFLTKGDGFDRALMGAWVARLDAGWRTYAGLTGALPRPFKQLGGKPVVAAVPGGGLTCGAGCGYVGATGIELAKFYDDDYPKLARRPASMPHYVFYEMGRNFYTFGDRHSCFITGFAVFMRYVCMDALRCADEEEGLRRTIEGVEPLLASSGHGFLDLFTMAGGLGEKAPRIKGADGRMVDPSDQPVCYAAAMLRLRREHGGDAWVKRFFRELAGCPGSPPGTREGALAQCWHWLLAASAAAGTDLGPVFAGQWGLPLDPHTRAALARVDWRKPGLTAAAVAAEVKPRWLAGEAAESMSSFHPGPP